MSKKDKRSKKQEAPAPEQQEADTKQPPQSQAPPAAGLEAERDDLLARLQRVSADYLNYQKRVQRDISEARQFANEELIKNLLGVLDDMERALAAARANHSEDDPLLCGMQLVHDKALQTLGKFGLVAIEALNRPFDPEKHSAVMQEPSGEQPPQTVLKELQKGYQLKGRTIRPSAVVVSISPDQAQQEASRAEEKPEGPDEDITE